MPIKTLDDLHSQVLGTVITAQELELSIPIQDKRRVSRWERETNGHQFTVGDVYVIPNDKREINSFKQYLKARFNLGLSVYEKDHKAYCSIRKLNAAPRHLRRNKEEQPSSEV